MNTKIAACGGLGTDVKCTTIFSLDPACVNKCMTDKFGFTPGCAPAFGNLTNCGFQKCKGPCISGDANNPNCVKCNEEKCDGQFHKDTGFTVDCQYFMDCNNGFQS